MGIIREYDPSDISGGIIWLNEKYNNEIKILEEIGKVDIVYGAISYYM